VSGTVSGTTEALVYMQTLNSKKAEKRIIKVIVLFFVVFVILFILLNINTKQLNGDALSGYKEAQKYFIKGTDGLKEVSMFLWYYNLFLWLSNLITAVISSIGFIYLMIRYALPLAYKTMKKQ
jgi:hypothetical protein